MRRLSTLLVAVFLIAVLVFLAQRRRSVDEAVTGTASDASATFVGSAPCARCHATETEAWRKSQHAGAMAVASETTVLGRFDNATLAYAGITSTFFRQDGRFYVRTDGADGKLANFEVTHTFGLYPLQQYLVPMPGGRLQALSIAWDARPKAAGGQRWFHLYATERVTSTDPLHWTGIRQNWNFTCADCHATNLKKGYDADARVFETTWTELGVGCEACHGPGSAHVSRMETGGAAKAAPAGLGLTARLDERKGVSGPLTRRRARLFAACRGRANAKSTSAPAATHGGRS